MRANLTGRDWNPHVVGNNLIQDMVPVYAKIITELENLPRMPQPAPLEVRVWKQSDFNEEAVLKVNGNFCGDYYGMMDTYLRDKDKRDAAYPIVVNPGL
jgi:hypothetical protein